MPTNPATQQKAAVPTQRPTASKPSIKILAKGEVRVGAALTRCTSIQKAMMRASTPIQTAFDVHRPEARRTPDSGGRRGRRRLSGCCASRPQYHRSAPPIRFADLLKTPT
jgi:hypothetical protein